VRTSRSGVEKLFAVKAEQQNQNFASHILIAVLPAWPGTQAQSSPGELENYVSTSELSPVLLL